jgi:hypothetical protein
VVTLPRLSGAPHPVLLLQTAPGNAHSVGPWWTPDGHRPARSKRVDDARFVEELRVPCLGQEDLHFLWERPLGFVIDITFRRCIQFCHSVDRKAGWHTKMRLEGSLPSCD